MSIDVDRSRRVTFQGIARKSAPRLVPDTLTAKMAVKIASAWPVACSRSPGRRNT